MVNVRHRLLQVVVILLAELHDSIFAVETLTDHFICLYKLVDFSRQFVILVADYADVIVHRVNFHLEIGIVLKQSAVRVSCTFQLLAHVEKLVFFLSNFHF